MTEAFKIEDTLEVAIRIEENGRKFYLHAVDIADDPKMKEFFKFVADEEGRHQKSFEGMLAKAEHTHHPETHPGEYCEYVKAYADNLVFPPEKVDAELGRIKTVEDALEFALQREIESILYYLEMKNFMPESHREMMDQVIDEERRHYLKLMEAKRNLN
jgi:rubrerythrin